MTDNRNNRGEPDRSLINVQQDHERRWWTRELGVSDDELRAAVKAVGESADAVREYLGKF